MTHKKTILTGITPSGTPHLGNYIGAIRPALALQQQMDAHYFYFIADYHSLVKLKDAGLRRQYIHEIAATWLACGLDADKVVFYRQSDVPQILELHWILETLSAKGLMNRAHAYKDAVAANIEKGEADHDAGINIGLYTYPVLMSADILLFNADIVPVGKDQIQHLEMARDIAGRFNHVYGNTFTLPQARVEEKAPTLPGLDGRKMSKSYDNAIPLFAESTMLKKLIFKIKTNSLMPGEPKDPDTCTLFQLYSAFADDVATAAMRGHYQAGLGWGDIKERVFAIVDAALSSAREEYRLLISHPEKIEAILAAGAQRARLLAEAQIKNIRRKVGIE